MKHALAPLAVLFGLLLVAGSVVAGTSLTPATQPTASPAPLPIDQMRAAIYTKEFARRFALPDPALGTEPMDGVQAIEYSMEEISSNGQFGDIGERKVRSCLIALYFDNTLPVAWPEEASAGVSNIPTRNPQFFSHIPKERFVRLSEPDRRSMNARWIRYLNLAQLVVTDAAYDKTGSMTSVDWEEYDRKAFAGLAYAKISIGCSMTDRVIESALRQKGRVSLWLKHAKASGYIKTDNPRPDEVVKLRLPHEFIERVLPWIRAGAQFNHLTLEEHNRINRDRRYREAVRQIDELQAGRDRDPGETKQLLDVMKRMDEAAQGRR